MNPLPGVSGGQEILPDLLTLEDPTRAEEVADSHLITGNWMTARLRQYLAAVYLAHSGRFVDTEGRILFDLTDPEAAAFLRAHTNRMWDAVARERKILSGDPDAPGRGDNEFVDYPFVRFNRYRECRAGGTEHEKAYRLYPQRLDPITEMR